MARRMAEAGSAGASTNNGRRGYNNRPLTKADLVDALAPLQKELNQHERKMDVMELAIKRIAQADTLGTRVENGLCEIAERLKPLENLRPPPEPTPLEPRDKQNLDDIVGSLERPKWSDATSIPVPNEPVLFVGQVPPTLQGRSKL